MILGYRVRHLVQQDRLPRARRRDDDSALPLSDRRHEIHHAHAEVAVGRLETKALIRILRPKVVEWHAILGLFRIFGVDALYLEECEITLPRLGRSDLAAHIIAGAKSEPLYLRR